MTNRLNTEQTRLRKVLHTIARQAQHASLTGALHGGETACVRQYNNILTRLQATGVLDDAIYRAAFSPLPEDANYDEIGISAGLLERCFDGALEDAEDDNSHAYRAAHHILVVVGKMAERASLTGHLEGGRSRLVGHYNAVQAGLNAVGVLPEGLFDMLEVESGTLGEVSVSAQQLAAYVEDGFDDPDPQLPDIPRTGRELLDIGQLVREAMPEWMRAEVAPHVEAAHEIQRVMDDLQSGRLADPDEISRRLAAIRQPRIPGAPVPPTPPTPPSPPKPPPPRSEPDEPR